MCDTRGYSRGSPGCSHGDRVKLLEDSELGWLVN